MNPNRRAIADLIAGRPMSTRKISEALGMPLESVRSNLRQMRQEMPIIRQVEGGVRVYSTRRRGRPIEDRPWVA